MQRHVPLTALPVASVPSHFQLPPPHPKVLTSVPLVPPSPTHYPRFSPLPSLCTSLYFHALHIFTFLDCQLQHLHPLLSHLHLLNSFPPYPHQSDPLPPPPRNYIHLLVWSLVVLSILILFPSAVDLTISTLPPLTFAFLRVTRNPLSRILSACVIVSIETR